MKVSPIFQVAAFAQEVGHLMDSGAFQKLKKIQQADEDVPRWAGAWSGSKSDG